MGDLISRQTVLTLFEKRFLELQIAKRLPENKVQEYEQSGVNWCINTVRDIPSVENKGEWIESKERSKHWYCSVCGGIHTDPETGKWRETFDYRYPFCPNCGADMRGKAE